MTTEDQFRVAVAGAGLDGCQARRNEIPRDNVLEVAINVVRGSRMAQKHLLREAQRGRQTAEPLALLCGEGFCCVAVGQAHGGKVRREQLSFVIPAYRREPECHQALRGRARL